jgi:Holliday junction resolvase
MSSGRGSQRKGADGERELASVLREYGYDMQRGGSLSFGEVPDLVGLPGVHIECKRVERLNVPEAMQQAVKDSQRFKDGMPALFHRRNRQPWLVTIRLEDFMQLYQGKE